MLVLSFLFLLLLTVYSYGYDMSVVDEYDIDIESVTTKNPYYLPGGVKKNKKSTDHVL